MTTTSAARAPAGPFYCSTSDVPFETETELREHYKSDWHRYNLKRKVAGLPPVTQEWFETRKAKLLAQHPSFPETAVGAPLRTDGMPDSAVHPAAATTSSKVWLCSLTRKTFASKKTYLEYTRTRKYAELVRQSGGAEPPPIVYDKRPVEAEAPVERKRQQRAAALENKRRTTEADDASDSSSGWETASEVDEGEAGPSIMTMEAMVTDEDGAGAEWDVRRCLFSGHVSDTAAANVEYMRLHFGFVVPERERLVDLDGLLRYLGAKLAIGHLPLYVSGMTTEAGRSDFRSLHAVQRHMVDTSQCRLLWEGNEDEYDDFYNFEGEDAGPEAGQLATSDGRGGANLALVTGGLELAVRAGDGRGERILGSREMARYYRQNHARPETRPTVLANAVVAKQRGVGLAAIRGTTAAVSKQQRTAQRWDRRRATTRQATIDRLSAFLPKDVPY